MVAISGRSKAVTVGASVSVRVMITVSLSAAETLPAASLAQP